MNCCHNAVTNSERTALRREVITAHACFGPIMEARVYELGDLFTPWRAERRDKYGGAL